MRNGRHLINPKIRDKCTEVRLGWTDYHIFVSNLYGSKAWVD